MTAWEPADEAEAERDRRTGLARLLAAIADVGSRVDATEAELARLHRRLDDMTAPPGGARPAPLQGEESLDHARRTVEASHRALVTQLQAMLDALADEQSRQLRDIALDVEAIRRAIERAGGSTR